VLLALAASKATYCCDPAATSMTDENTTKTCCILSLLWPFVVEDIRQPADMLEKNNGCGQAMIKNATQSARVPDSMDG
jgi:hypothetical protein